MAAFSYQHYPFHIDSVFFPNTPIKNLSGFMDEANNNNTNYFSQFYPSPPPHELLDDDDNEPNCSVTKKQSTDSSSSSVVVDHKLVESGEQVTQQLNHHNHHNSNSNNSMENKKRKKKTSNNASSSTSSRSKDNVGQDEKKGRIKKQKIEKKEEEDKKSKAKKKVLDEEPPTGYIHVRARRGQATDSHSLAERVRREKISERMKMLQRLVPGCDKVTGKALMLDEIINYVQSLQNQVEFLSMKLASVNPLFYDFGMDLDALTLRPEGLSSNYTPSLSPIILQHQQQQSPAALPTAFADATATTTTTTTAAASVATFAAANNNYLPAAIDHSLLLQAQRPCDFIQQENGSLMWDVDEQRQKFMNQSGIISDNLCSFH